MPPGGEGGGVLDRRYVLDLVYGRSRMTRGGKTDILDLIHGRSRRMTIDPRVPTHNAGTEHARLSPTRQTLLVWTKRDAKREVSKREVSSESNEG